MFEVTFEPLFHGKMQFIKAARSVAAFYLDENLLHESASVADWANCESLWAKITNKLRRLCRKLIDHVNLGTLTSGELLDVPVGIIPTVVLFGADTTANFSNQTFSRELSHV